MRSEKAVWHIEELERRSLSIKDHITRAWTFATDHDLEEIGGEIGNLECSIDEIFGLLDDEKDKSEEKVVPNEK